MNAPGLAPAVLVDDLVVRFGDITAVGGVSFAVAPGEVFALLHQPAHIDDRQALAVAFGLLHAVGGEEDRRP